MTTRKIKPANDTPEPAFATTPRKKPVEKGATSVVRDLTPRPILLVGENEKDYQAFCDACLKDLNPQDVIAEMLVLDVIEYSWESARYRQLKTATITAARRDAVSKLMEQCMSDGDQPNYKIREIAESYAHGWSAKWEDHVKETEDEFREHGIGESEIHAVCYSLRLKEIESIDRLIGTSDYRRNSALKELERHHESLAKRARAYIENNIAEADYEEMGP